LSVVVASAWRTTCPRRADAYLVAIAGEYPGTPIAEVCQGFRFGLQQARVAVRD